MVLQRFFIMVARWARPRKEGCVKKTISTKDLMGAPVLGGKDGATRVGKVHACVFHPSEKRCIGVLVKRPDLLLMFRRPDSFVPLDGFSWEDRKVHLRDDSGTSGAAACKKMGISWDDCVIWLGLPLCSESGEQAGYVGAVTFDRQTGVVESVAVSENAANDALLGQIHVPASLILGFKRGAGSQLACYDEEGVASEEQLGALLVKNEALEAQAQGGLARKAGETAARAESKVAQATDVVKPKAAHAAERAGSAVNKGAYAAGRQIARAKGMFGAFAREYKKAKK